jgi:hypothetical protein
MTGKKTAKQLLGVERFEQYAATDYAELHLELVKMLKQAPRLENWLDRHNKRLLSALLAMKGLVAKPGRRVAVGDDPNWETECRSLRITPGRVRTWKYRRTASEIDINRLFGGQKEVPRKRVSESQSRRYLRRLKNLILAGNTADAKELARRIDEEFPTL